MYGDRSSSWVAIVIAGIAAAGALNAQPRQYSPSYLSAIRAAAGMVPGDLPVSLRYLKYGESVLSTAVVLEGGTSTPIVGAFTVFQIEFRDGWITVDAGHDAEVDQSFTAQSGHRFWQDRYDSVQQALRDSRMNAVTHEHPDHVAGVLRSKYPQQVIPKTVLTREQVLALQTEPMVSLIHLTPEASAAYRVVEYESFYPIAPGVVLIKAPGHSPGSQMVYVRLASGTEAIFIGDIEYAMAGIASRRQKPESTSRSLREDRAKIQEQVNWLHNAAEAGVALIPCHDDAWLSTLAERGIVKSGLATTHR